MGGRTAKWATISANRRVSENGSEAADGKGDMLMPLRPGQKGSKRLEAYLATRLKPLPDPADALWKPAAFSTRELWLRDVLDCCDD